MDNILCETLADKSGVGFGENEINLIESIIDTQGFDEDVFKEELIYYSVAMRRVKTSNTEKYIKAVQYVSHINSGMSQVKAYKATFPERAEQKRNPKTLVGSAGAYHRSELVKALLDITDMKAHVAFIAHRHQMHMKLYSLATDPDVSPRIQMESADKFLAHTKPPETLEVTHNLGISDDMIGQIDNKLEELAKKQIQHVRDGGTAQDIVDAEIVRKAYD